MNLSRAFTARQDARRVRALSVRISLGLRGPGLVQFLAPHVLEYFVRPLLDFADVGSLTELLDRAEGSFFLLGEFDPFRLLRLS